MCHCKDALICGILIEAEKLSLMFSCSLNKKRVYYNRYIHDYIHKLELLILHKL